MTHEQASRAFDTSVRPDFRRDSDDSGDGAVQRSKTFDEYFKRITDEEELRKQQQQQPTPRRDSDEEKDQGVYSDDEANAVNSRQPIYSTLPVVGDAGTTAFKPYKKNRDEQYKWDQTYNQHSGQDDDAANHGMTPPFGTFNQFTMNTPDSSSLQSEVENLRRKVNLLALKTNQMSSS